MFKYIATRAAAIVFLVSITGVASSYAQGPLGQILNRMDAHNKLIRTLEASVTMVKSNGQLGVSDTNVGTTTYLKNGEKSRYVRIDWKSPVEESISVMGDRYELYRPRLNQVIRGTVGKAKNSAAAGGALSFMSMSKTQLKQNYDVTYIGEEQIRGGVQTIHLLLKPIGPNSYKSADLWVDKDGMPRQAKVTEKNDDTTTILLENIQKNPSINASVFKLNYDKNKVQFVNA